MALQMLIGKICHIYLDDIIIWSDSMEDHIQDVRTVFAALRAAQLYINEKKDQFVPNRDQILGT